MIDMQNEKTLKVLRDVASSENGILLEFLKKERDELDTNEINIEKTDDLKLEYLATRKARDKIDIIINILSASMD